MTSQTTPWLPDLPASWKRAQIRRVAEIRNGADYKAVEVAEGGYPVYGSGGEFRRAGRYLFDGESVLFGRKGTIDRPLHVKGRFWTVDTMFYTDLDRAMVVPRYLYYYATTMPFGLYATNTALPSVTGAQIASHTMPLPPLEVQRAIADYLDRETARIDTLIEEQQRLIEMLRERRRAVIEWRIADIEADRAALRYCARLVSGSGFPVAAQGNVDEELPFFKVKDLQSADHHGILLPAADTVSRDTAATLRATVIPRGSIVFAKVGAALKLGRVGSLPVDGCIDNNMSALIFDSTMDPYFARYVLLTFDFGRFVHPGAVPSLNMEAVREFKFPLVSRDRQRSIVENLDEEIAKIDELIAESERFIELSRERRAALITAAVTGQIDVREVA